MLHASIRCLVKYLPFCLFGLVVALSWGCQKIQWSGNPGSPLRARYHSFLRCSAIRCSSEREVLCSPNTYWNRSVFLFNGSYTAILFGSTFRNGFLFSAVPEMRTGHCAHQRGNFETPRSSPSLTPTHINMRMRVMRYSRCAAQNAVFIYGDIRRDQAVQPSCTYILLLQGESQVKFARSRLDTCLLNLR